MIIFEDTNTVGDALWLLSKFKKLYAPVCRVHNEGGTVEFYGFVCVLDLLSYLVTLHDDVCDGNLVGLYYQGQIFMNTPIKQLIHYSKTNPVNNGPQVMKSSSLYTAMGVFQKRILRVAVRDDTGRVVNVLDHLDVVNFLMSTMDFKLYTDIYDKTIAELGIDYGKAWTITDSEPTITAFKIMNQNSLSTIAVVNEFGELLGSLDASNLEGALMLGSYDVQRGESPFNCLFLPVSTFHQRNGMSAIPTPTCTLDTPFYYLLLQFAARKNGLQAAWIVDELNRPIGCITLTTMMKALVNIKQEDRQE